MPVLFLTSQDPDYGADWLYHGFCSLLGYQNVIDWPVKASLHQKGAPRFDCDQQWPQHGWNAGQIADSLRSQLFDLVVVPTLRSPVPELLGEWRRAGLFYGNEGVTVCYDGEDAAVQLAWGAVLGFTPAAEFKRELPVGASWAQPLPFGYPAERVVALGDEPREPICAYAVHIWPWVVGGLRERIGQALLHHPRTRDRCRVRMSRTHTERLSLEQYHEANRAALVAVSPPGAGYGCNRHFEIIADGCAPVYQWPDKIQHPMLPSTAATYCHGLDDTVNAVIELLDDPWATHHMAKAAQAELLAAHTTRHRAVTVWESVHGKLAA